MLLLAVILECLSQKKLQNCFRHNIRKQLHCAQMIFSAICVVKIVQIGEIDKDVTKQFCTVFGGWGDTM